MTDIEKRLDQIEAACIERFKEQGVNAEAVGQMKQFMALQGAWIEGAEWADANPAQSRKPVWELVGLTADEKEKLRLLNRALELSPIIKNSFPQDKPREWAEWNLLLDNFPGEDRLLSFLAKTLNRIDQALSTRI